MISSLRGRLTASLVVVMVGSLAVWLFVFHVLVHRELYDRFDDGLVAHMQALAAYMSQNPGTEEIAEYMPEFRTQAHEEFFQVWDANGRILARSDSSAGRDLPKLAAVRGVPTFHDLDLPDGHRGRAAIQTFGLPAGDRRGSITVATAAETGPLEDLEERLHGLVLVGTLVTVAFSVAIAWISTARSLRPLARLSRSVAAIDPDSPVVRIDSGELPTELAPVAGKIQVMAQSLVDALGRERRFTRNVAHELRTPLTEVRTLAEVGAMAADLEQATAAFHEITATSQELDQIVDALLSLARYEAGIERPDPEPVELGGEVRHQAAYLEDVARERQLRIMLDTPESWVFVDGALTRRLVANLLGNAVAHAPAGATVDVHVRADGFTIENPAPRLQEADLARLDERFFRIGDGGGGGHAGLGLSLARAIVRILGLSLRLALSPTGRLEATVTGFAPLPG